jgi:formylglycine-generating enzyme required for sulfatase activity
VLLRATPKLDGNTKIKGYDFASEADEKQAKALMELRRYLQDFGGVSRSSNGLHVPVRAKLWTAKAAEAHGREVESRPRAWEEAIAAIEKHDLYGGMRLRVHEGLRPLGPDPDSRLWEFVHVASGRPGYAIPWRDRATGRIVPHDDMGIVLVLLPGGEFWMGAQKGDASKPNYDPQATDREGPVHRVTLSPFFVGKHEVTQGQWLRWGGTLPKESRFLSGDKQRPVFSVSWDEVDAATRKAGLLLPTEAQWEYACRAGSSTPWWTGSEEAELAKGAVFGDAPLAAVGTKAANRFGLFDTAGNVWEWCCDAYGDYPSSIVADPLVVSGPNRVYRGGSWLNSAGICSSAFRDFYIPGFTVGYIGFRVVLAPVLVQ